MWLHYSQVSQSEGNFSSFSYENIWAPCTLVLWWARYISLWITMIRVRTCSLICTHSTLSTRSKVNPLYGFRHHTGCEGRQPILFKDFPCCQQNCLPLFKRESIQCIIVPEQSCRRRETLGKGNSATDMNTYWPTEMFMLPRKFAGVVLRSTSVVSWWNAFLVNWRTWNTDARWKLSMMLSSNIQTW